MGVGVDAGLPTAKSPITVMPLWGTRPEWGTELEGKEGGARSRFHIPASPQPFPTGRRYSVILADPPWHYNDRRVARQDGGHPRFGFGAGNHYPLMRTPDICALPVARDLAADNCALFLWGTPPNLPAAFQVLEAWGFTYKTFGFVWVKVNKCDGKPFFGVGYYSKSNTEPCLLGVRGRMKPSSNSISQIVMAARGEHSQKPDQVHEMIETLFGDVPRIELFAREKRDGWDSWGLEADERLEKVVDYAH